MVAFDDFSNSRKNSKCVFMFDDFLEFGFSDFSLETGLPLTGDSENVPLEIFFTRYLAFDIGLSLKLVDFDLL